MNTSIVLPVGIFEGKNKPLDNNEFLKPTVTEMCNLMANGFTWRDKCFEIRMGAFICDAAVRAFVLGVKNHNGYNACSKCTQKGEYLNKRVIYGVENCDLRTDLSFRNRVNPEHHNKVNELVLETMNFDIVENFALDYMHVVCLLRCC